MQPRHWQSRHALAKIFPPGRGRSARTKRTPGVELLVLHIGTHKTGTSAIQAALARADALQPLGVHFVEAGREGRGAHHALAWSLRNRYKTPLSVWDGVRAELARDDSRVKVLSSEAFWYEHPLEVKRQLAWRGEIRIVAYLQRQDRYLQTLYRQNAAGGQSVTFADWVREWGHRGEYLAALEDWAEHFGRHAIVVRPFERGGETIDAVKDFFDVLGVDAGSAGFKPAARTPSQPLPAVQHFLRAFNHLGLDHDKLLSSLAKRRKTCGRSADLLSYDEARALMARFADGNRILAERFWRSDADPLFPPLEPRPAEFNLDDPEFFSLTVDVLDAVVELVAAQSAGTGDIRRKKPPPIKPA